MAITDDLGALIRENFLHNPTKEQEKAISLLSDFLLSREQDSIFLLKGYAGTGKTSLLAALVRTMQQLRLRVMLLAPTGRAAKVLSNYAGAPAFTIHRKIYRQKSITEMDVFQNNINMRQDTLFIVDEASMIANDAHEQTMFGTGRLLDDLMQYVYSCNGCRLLLVGDTAQLPPVGETESPALSRTMLEGYGMEVTELCLTQVVRQLEESGILWNATMLRSLIQNDDVYAFPKLRGKSFPDIKVLPGNELIEALEQSYRNHGTDGTIVVPRSNKRANIFNNGIRTRILDYETELSGGDLIMVAKNNYYWTEREQAANGVAADAMTFIANGDVAELVKIGNYEERYGLNFAQATLRFPDYDDVEIDAKIVLDTLHSVSPALDKEQQRALFEGVYADYDHITVRKKRMEKVREDQYYNALQIKYATAITGHKSQGSSIRTFFKL